MTDYSAHDALACLHSRSQPATGVSITRAPVQWSVTLVQGPWYRAAVMFVLHASAAHAVHRKDATPSVRVCIAQPCDSELCEPMAILSDPLEYPVGPNAVLEGSGGERKRGEGGSAKGTLLLTIVALFR